MPILAKGICLLTWAYRRVLLLSRPEARKQRPRRILGFLLGARIGSFLLDVAPLARLRAPAAPDRDRLYAGKAVSLRQQRYLEVLAGFEAGDVARRAVRPTEVL